MIKQYLAVIRNQLSRAGKRINKVAQARSSQPVIFILLFAAIGSYILIRSFAAPISPSIEPPSNLASGVIAQPANNASAQVIWKEPSPAPDGWNLQTYDSGGKLISTVQCWDCTTQRITGLVVGHQYYWKVSALQKTSQAGIGTISSDSVTSNTINIDFDQKPSVLSSLQINIVRGDQQMTIHWRPSNSGQAADTTDFDVINADNNQKIGGLSLVNAYQGSKTIPAVPGNWYVTGSAINSSGGSADIKSNTITINDSCHIADACLHVISGTGLGPEKLIGQGFLHGYRNNSYTLNVDTKLVSALKPQQWRLTESNPSEYSSIAHYGDQTTQVISDFWYNATSRAGYAATPWSNWPVFQTFVTNLVNQAKAQGWSPDYWDLFNEPDSLGQYFSPADQASLTANDLLQMFKVEYKAVKAADPKAKIVAPSLTLYQDVPEGNNKINMTNFIQFAAANNMKLDAVSWHENSDSKGGPDWFMRSAPWNIDDHVSRFRQLIAQNPAVGNPIVLINEYASSQTHLVPAMQLGYFVAFEESGVSGASRACWAAWECSDPSLDGLLTQTGSTWQGTLPVYWVAKDYADMKGSTRLQMTSSMSPRINGLAVRDDNSKTIKVLLGQHWSCDQIYNAWCQTSYRGSDLKTKIAIDWPYASKTALLTINQIPAGLTPIKGPTFVSSTRVTVDNGKIVTILPAVADGDAYSLTAVAN